MRRHIDAQLIGNSPEIQALRQEIASLSSSDARVLVTGESGVGKEIVAREIHAGSRRAGAAFVAMNCAGMTESLLESELFGHARGSFTGAYRDKAGKLELGNRGTVFLDEVGEMTLRMQGLLLRFLETGELEKVGSDGAVSPIDVRVVAATNRDLRTSVEEGRFREDLFYRLNVIHLHVPSLRERRQDIPALVEHFLEHFSRQAAIGAALPARTMRTVRRPSGTDGSWADEQLATDQSHHRGAADVRPSDGEDTPRVGSESRLICRRIAPDAMAALVRYPWPGNVRQLQNVIEGVMIRTHGECVTADDLPLEIRSYGGLPINPRQERRRTIADELYDKLRIERQSFWTTVYRMYMSRQITKENVRDVVRKGLAEAGGNYRSLALLFNMERRDYKRFASFLRKHDCQVSLEQ